MMVDVGRPLAATLRHGNRLLRHPPLPRERAGGLKSNARHRRATLAGVAR